MQLTGPPKLNGWEAPYCSAQTPMQAAFQVDSVTVQGRQGTVFTRETRLRGRFTLEWRGLPYEVASRILYEIRTGELTLTPRTDKGGGGFVDLTGDGVPDIVISEVDLPCRVVDRIPTSSQLDAYAQGDRVAQLSIQLETTQTYAEVPGFTTPESTTFQVQGDSGDQLALDLTGAGTITYIVQDSAGQTVDVVDGPNLSYALPGSDTYDIVMVAQPSFGGVTEVAFNPYEGSETINLSTVDLSLFVDAESVFLERGTYGGTLGDVQWPPNMTGEIFIAQRGAPELKITNFPDAPITVRGAIPNSGFRSNVSISLSEIQPSWLTLNLGDTSNEITEGTLSGTYALREYNARGPTHLSYSMTEWMGFFPALEEIIGFGIQVYGDASQFFNRPEARVVGYNHQGASTLSGATAPDTLFIDLRSDTDGGPITTPPTAFETYDGGSSNVNIVDRLSKIYALPTDAWICEPVDNPVQELRFSKSYDQAGSPYYVDSVPEQVGDGSTSQANIQSYSAPTNAASAPASWTDGSGNYKKGGMNDFVINVLKPSADAGTINPNINLRLIEAGRKSADGALNNTTLTNTLTEEAILALQNDILPKIASIESPIVQYYTV